MVSLALCCSSMKFVFCNKKLSKINKQIFDLKAKTDFIIEIQYLNGAIIKYLFLAQILKIRDWTVK